jgi:hypothetical protein
MADTSSDVTGELRDPSGAVIRLYGTISGDSIVGKVFWLKFVARSPPQYRGRFVARRRP